MFKSLKERLQSWAKNFSKKKQDEEELEETEEKPAKQSKKDKKAEKSAKKQKTKKERNKPDNRKGKKDKKSKGRKQEQKIEEEQQEIEGSPGEQEAENIEEKETEQTEAPKRLGFFQRFREKIGKVKISEKDFEEYKDDLEMLLLENNVALEVTEKIIETLKEKLIDKEFPKKDLLKEIQNVLREIIEEVLVEPFDILQAIKDKRKTGKPYVILFCGINGSGKTTTIAKVAEMLKKQKISCILAAGDTFRAASIEQLKKHGERLNIEVVANEYGSDPASVGFDAIKAATKNKIDCVLIDTAGRMHTAKNLLKEIEKIARVCAPDTKIFVGESITGNDALEQVKGFDESIGIDGIILTKADIDEKGGTALSVGYVTKKPILFLGTGQEYHEIELFNKKKFTDSLGI
ncbi:MAG TPA: signal recognition particle-docking protein FtsY [Candidatus Pacearchaeota archaeon]|nr:signal recognition particle-docking protein FtsY [Candidatus Pacearchaeota archaeon]